MAIDYVKLNEKRPDVARYYVTVDPAWQHASLDAIFADWWTLDRAAANDPSAHYSTLTDYAAALGCLTNYVQPSVTVTGSAPTTTVGSTPPAAPPPSFSITNTIMALFHTENPTVAAAILIAGGYVVYKVLRKGTD